MKPDYIEFQERSSPLAFLITFRCYGTWLHGDQRGSVDRRYYDLIRTLKIPACESVEGTKAKLMKHDPFVPGARERLIVETAIREVCHVREYALFALNIRTNHTHIVVSNSGEPERMMGSFKSYATRPLRAEGLVNGKRKVWSRHGSSRYLWTDT